jgi:ribonuclease T1
MKDTMRAGAGSTIARAWLAAILLGCAALTLPAAAQRAQPRESPEVSVRELPREVGATIELIRRGGPFPYAKDGAVFGNRENLLPRRERGYYHEYTVKTPGERTRGARRIIAGSGGEHYYTDDHYNHFRRVRD